MDQVPPVPVNLNTTSLRYYCHVCRAEVRVTAEFTCVQCSGSFVEEITESSFGDLPRLLRLLRRTQPFVPQQVPQNNQHETQNSNNNSCQSQHSEASFNSTLSSVNADDVGNENTNNTSAETTASGRGEQFRNILTNVFVDVLDLLGGTNDAPQTSRRGIFTDNIRTRARDVVSNRNASFAERMNEFINLAFSPTGGLSANVNLGNQTFVLNNPNDYVNYSGLANELMNTLNHLLPSISRPLTNENLDQIPKVEVTAEDLTSQNRCAICWEDFELKESVRKLPCTHLFHKNCIFPWLKLHRTCPVCRSRLTEDMGLGGSNTDGQTIHDNNIIDVSDTDTDPDPEDT